MRQDLGVGRLTLASRPPPPAAPRRHTFQPAGFKQHAGSAVNPLTHFGPGSVDLDFGRAVLKVPQMSRFMKSRQFRHTNLIFFK